MNTTVGAKRILVYGDSLTWGRIANIPDRFNEQTRFTGVLQRELGNNYEVIEEGLRARMLKGENPNYEGRDGFAQFGPILTSHLPLDLLVIFLGTNDMNTKSSKSPQETAEGLNDYFAALPKWAASIQTPIPRQVLIIAPPVIKEEVMQEGSIFAGGGQKSQQLPALYQHIASKHGALFFDASKVVEAGQEDGVHLTAEANVKLGQTLALFIKENIN